MILWAIDAGVRAVKTVAQTAVGSLAGAVIFSEVDWMFVGSASLFAGVLSLLMSISTIPIMDYLKEHVEMETELLEEKEG